MSQNLTIAPLEIEADDIYQQTIRALNACFRVQENAAYERHVLRQLRQEPGENELEFAVRDELLEKVSSQELRTNIQLAAALTTARAWETACRQASKISGGKEKSSLNLVQHRASKEKPSGQGMQKCYAWGRSGVLRRERCVLSVAREGTGQRVARMRQMENGK